MLCLHGRSTVNGKQNQDYANFFRMCDSSSRVLHLKAEPLPKAGKKGNKQEEEDRSRKARK
jgi:hypothetical protein